MALAGTNGGMWYGKDKPPVPALTEEQLAKMKADAIGTPCCSDNDLIQESYEKQLERHRRGY